MGNKRVNGSHDISRDVFFLEDSSSRRRVGSFEKKKREKFDSIFNTIIIRARLIDVLSEKIFKSNIQFIFARYF